MTAHKNECPAVTGQFVKTLTKNNVDFIAFFQRNANSNIALELTPSGWSPVLLYVLKGL